MVFLGRYILASEAQCPEVKSEAGEEIFWNWPNHVCDTNEKLPWLPSRIMPFTPDHFPIAPLWQSETSARLTRLYLKPHAKV